MNKLPKTLLNANGRMIMEKGELISESSMNGPIYLFEAFDKLIEDTGRFCERHQTDLMIALNSLIRKIKETNDGLYYFGIREMGVDHNSYVFLRLKDNSFDKYFADNYYRKIYALEFHKTKDYDHILITYTLKDMSKSLRYEREDDNFPINEIDEEDENE